jgi:hypothetical protein
MMSILNLPRSNLPDVTLSNQDTGMMDTLRKAEFVDASLQTTLQEVFNLESKHVIELHARFVEHANANKTANERITFEEALGVFLVKGEKLTRLLQYQLNRSY